MKRLIVGLLVGGLMTAMLPAVVTAAQPDKGDVTIDSRMIFRDPPPNRGRFQATGDILCSEGTVVDLGDVKVVGFNKRFAKLQITVFKRFTCRNGTDTFDMKLQVHLLTEDFTERFSWVVTGGTGAYKGLRGSGGGYSIPFADFSGTTNYYDGFVIN